MRGDQLAARRAHPGPQRRVGGQRVQPGRQLGDVAGLEQPAVAAGAAQVRQRHRVGGHDRLARRHGLHRRQALQLGHAGHAEDVGARVGLEQLLLVHEAPEPHPVGDAELVGELLPLRAARAVADQVDLHQRHERGGAQQLVDPLLLVEPAHEQHGRPVVGGRRVAAVAVDVDAAGHRHRAAREPVVVQQGHRAGRGGGDHVGDVEDAAQVAPGPAGGDALEPAGDVGVAEQVLRHEVVGRGGRDAAPGGQAQGVAADDEVRLHVDDVRADRVEHARDVLRHLPGHADPERAVERGAVRAQAVHGDAVHPLGSGPAAGVQADDVHVVPATGEPDREAVREARGAVDVRGEGLGGDEDAQGAAVVHVVLRSEVVDSLHQGTGSPGGGAPPRGTALAGSRAPVR
ncbi:hypothetical protein APASM_5209 [Actinosynnema pretiosum subsp. pretiosum]|nr:hypothetical protein APASM_5209 [Actinosynnema pretiosum subsp. pretiosum]